MKAVKKLACVLAAIAASATFAEEVSQEQAQQAVRNWIHRNPQPMTVRFASGNGEAKTFSKDGKALFHVVQLEGGGFVVTSGDTKINPIIAFCDSGEFVADSQNPLYALLEKDMSNRIESTVATRQKASKGGNLLKASPVSAAERMWAELIAVSDETPDDDAPPSPKAGLSGISDLRVAPMVKSKWNQTGRWSGNYIWNHYTPDHCYCGCTATAVAQVMRYWEEPKHYVQQYARLCKIEGVETEETMKGGYYDWGNMPLSKDEITDPSQCEAIGRLTFDVGVASKMSWSAGGSGAGLGDAAEGLKTCFGYASADYVNESPVTGNLFSMPYANDVLGSLNAGMPAVLGIYLNFNGKYEYGHAIVIDGYGYHNLVMYSHLNIGYGGNGDAWYNLFDETVTAGGNSWDTVWACIVNINPAETGRVLSGRVLDQAGAAVSGAEVSVVSPSQARVSVTSDANGIWFIRTQEGDGDFYVTAEKSGMSSEMEKVTSPVKNGNLWNVDLTLLSSDSPKPDLCFVQPDKWTGAVFLSNAEDATTAETVFLPGETIYLYNRFGNKGAAAITRDYIILHEVLDASGAVISSVPCECTSSLWLTAGESRVWGGVTFAIPQNLSSGRYTYRCTLDSGWAIAESNESNNIATIDFTVVDSSSKPDLCFVRRDEWPKAVFLSDTAGATTAKDSFEEGDAIYLYNRFGNQGTSPITKNYAILHEVLDSSGAVVVSGTYNCTSSLWLDAGVAKQWGGVLYPVLQNLPAGRYTYRCTLDSEKVIAEEDEFNNTATAEFTVAPPSTYTLTVNPNGGILNGSNFGGADGTGQQTSVTVTYGTIYYWWLGTATWSGHVFDGWWTSASGGEQVYDSEGKAIVGSSYWDDSWQWRYRGDLTVYAHWKQNDTLSAPTPQTLSGDESGIRISFGASANAVGYRIYRAETKSKPGDCYDEIQASSSTTVEYSDTSANPGVEYHYWVSAIGTGVAESDAAYCGVSCHIASIWALPNDVSFDANGGEKSVSVSANAEWEVQSKPAWLTAVKTTVQANGGTEVVLVISADAVSTEREGTVSLVAAKGTAHPALAEIHVSQSAEVKPTPPDWTVDHSKWEDNMTVYAVVSNTTTRSNIEAIGSLLAAFDSNGDCRGVASMADYTAYGLGKLFQLTVSISSSSEKGLSLKVWNAATGETLDVAETFDANADKVLGAIDMPRIFKAGDMEIAIALRQGWNWFSTCLSVGDCKAATVLGGFTFANGDIVKTAGESATYQNGVWLPTSFTISPGVAYCVKKSAGGMETVTLSGSPMDNSINVHTGWNWMGSTLADATAISKASHSGGFSNGDIVKSQSASATFQNSVWLPGTFSLVPGTGYKMRLAKAGTIAFGGNPAAPPATAAMAYGAKALTDSNAPAWTADHSRWEDNMTVYVIVSNVTTRSSVETSGSLLAAFDSNGDCRGVVSVEDYTAYGLDKLFQLTVSIDSAPETGLSLRVWDAGTGETLDVAETFDTNADKVLGAINAPIVAHVASPVETYTISFGKNGGNGTMSDQAVRKNTATKLNGCAFTKTGHSFTQWRGSDGKFYQDRQSVTLSANLALTAQWTANIYAATFSANDGTGGTTRTLAYGATLAAPTVSRTGYTLTGWSPAVPATMPAGNATYVAQWRATTYKVVFNANGGKLPKGKKMKAQTMTYGTAAKLRKNVFTREGSVFAGWATSAANAKKGVIAYRNAQSVMNLRSDGQTTTLYAVWAKKTYKVAFYANGGKGKMKVQAFTYGKAKRLSANKFKRKGYTFKGWAKSKSLAKKGKVAYRNKKKVKNLLRNGKTVKLYAVWKKK